MIAKVVPRSVINAPIDAVWTKIRDLNALPVWHPGATDSQMEGCEPRDRVSCIRNFNLADV